MREALRTAPWRGAAAVLVVVVALLGTAGDGSASAAVAGAGAATEVAAGGAPAAGTGGAGGAGGGPPAAGAAVPGLDAWPYSWPLTPAPVVVRPFQEPAHRFGPGHRGVDLGAAPGVAVYAAAAGIVVFAAALAGRGVVSVQHPDGLRTTYEPVTPLVHPGARVPRGGVLGTLQPGHAGCSAACLHWGVRRDRTTYVDPLVLLAPPRVRLLPVPDPWPDGLGGGEARRREVEPVTPGGAPARGPP
jgi:murein DD-endopeptidase MepM/ murein hydrolase activator NlpD